MPAPAPVELYEVVEDGDGTYAVVLGGSIIPIVIDGVPQRGLDIQDADDVADSLEAIARITASRGTGTVSG